MVITMKHQHMTHEGINEDIRHQTKKYIAFVFLMLMLTFLASPYAVAEAAISEMASSDIATPERATQETVMAEASAYNGMVSGIAIDDADVKAVQRVIGGQIYALKSGNHQTAYSYAAPNVQQAFPSVKNFISMVQKGYRPLYQHTSYIFGKNTTSNGEVYQEVIVSDETRQLWQFIYTLKQQKDYSWKVTNVVMYPYQGTSV
jgi:hypothetical protein